MKRVLLLTVLVGCNNSSAPVIDSTPPEPLPTASTVPEAPVPESVEEEHAQRLLTSFTTKFKTGPKLAGRVANIELLSKTLAAFDLEPDAEWSFNDTVGPRTEAAGFQNAPTYFMGEIVEGIGGGTCQVSSTLFAALLLSGTAITDRHPHSRPASYIEPGLDATVSFPEACAKKLDPTICYDFKFKNSYAFPLHIEVKAADEIVEDKRELTVSVFGTGEIPKATCRWGAWASPAFDKRVRRVSYWKNDRKRLKQAGQPGLEGARYLTLNFLDGHVEKREIISRYKPVPEVWEVGVLWKDDPGL